MRLWNQLEGYLKGKRHKRREKVNHSKQIEKWDAKYKSVYLCEAQWEGVDHLKGLGEGRLGILRSQ